MDNQTLAIAIIIVFALYAFGVVGKSNNNSMRMIQSFLKGLFSIFKGIYKVLHWLFTGAYKKQEIYGTAKFIESDGRSELISTQNDGLVVENESKLTEKQSMQGAVIVAPIGAGKTTTYVINQALVQEKADRTLVYTDPSGEIYNQTSGYLASIGYKIERIDFSSINKCTFRYNPLAKVSDYGDIERISEVLIRSAYPEQSADSSFWNDFAQGIISTHLRCLLSPKVEKKYQNLTNLRYLLNNFGRNGQPLLDFYLATADPVTNSEIKGILGTSEKTLLSALANAKTALKLFANPTVSQTTSGSPEHNFEDLRCTPSCLYIGLPEDQQTMYQPLLSLFYSELMSFCMKMPEGNNLYLPIYIILEEAGQLVVPELKSYACTLRKRRANLSLILQHERQLYKNYQRDDAETILANCANKIYFPGLDNDTCRRLENALGNETIEFSEPTRNPFGGGDTYRPIRLAGKPLMFADEIRTMQHPLMLCGNLRPTILKNMIPFFENPKLLKRSKIPPIEVPQQEERPIEYLDLASFTHTVES